MHSEHLGPGSNKEHTELVARLEALGWGLFLVWIGFAYLLDVGIGIGLVGIGVITIGVQIIRKMFNLSIEGFWFIVGLCFLAGGVSELTNVDIPVAPILLIACGIGVLVSVFKRPRQ